MNCKILITYSCALLLLSSCAKIEVHHTHKALFVHYATGTPLPGVKIKVVRTTYSLDDPFGTSAYYATLSTDERGGLTIDAAGTFDYTAISDTLRGPMTPLVYGSQGEYRDGIKLYKLYPYTRLVFAHGAGKYLNVDITTKPQAGVPNYDVMDLAGASFQPSTINNAVVPLLTHQPNDVHVTVTLPDSSVVEHDYTITPDNFAPVTLTIPH